jgi:hypothetical protein
MSHHKNSRQKEILATNLCLFPKTKQIIMILKENNKDPITGKKIC